MRQTLLTCLALTIVGGELPGLTGAADEAAVELFVATDGDDANPGTLAMPMRSLEAARDRLRQLRSRSTDAKPVTVWIRGGVYYCQRTFQLTQEDGGTASLPVSYRTYGREEVRLVGGRKLEPDWCQPVRDAEVLARLPEAVRGHVLQVDLKAHGMEGYGELSILAPMLELFSDGQRLPLAGYPNEGWMHLGSIVQVDSQGQRRRVDGNKQGTTFCYSDDRPRRWQGAGQLVLHGFWWFGWTDEHVPVQQIDVDRREITLVQVPSGGMRKDQWFRALNLLEEIDVPGEWYLDRPDGILYFFPPHGFPDKPLFVSTLVEPLVRIDGASHVTIRDLILEVTRGVGMVIGGGEHNRLAGCTLRGIGSDAVVIDHGQRNGLVGCDIHDVGGTAVHITGGNRSTLEAAGNYVRNCHIFDYAQRKLVYRPAVRLYGVGHHLANNLIHDAPHQAIAYDGNDHLIELNEIHHVVLNSADAGVMYTGRDWTFRGNVVRHNFVHHIPHGPGLGTVGIYLDDCCSSTTIFGNVFFDMLKPAFIGGGRDNVVANNVFIECDTPVYLDNRGLRWDHFRPDGPMYETLRRVPFDQPPWSTRYPALARILSECPQAPLGNILKDNVSYRSSWRDAEAYCRDTSEKNIETPYLTVGDNFVTDEDPGFVDAPQMDFRLRADSIVYRRLPQFEPIPFERIGLQPDEWRGESERGRASSAER